MFRCEGKARAALVVTLLFLVITPGCGDDRAAPPATDAAASKLDAIVKDAGSSLEKGNAGDGATTPDKQGPAKAGKILLSVSTIKGQKGRALLAFHGNQSRLCAFISSDLFSLPPTAMTKNPGGGNPCGPKTAFTTFQPGTYLITAGIYIPGKQVPEKSTSFKVTVNGDTTAKVNGAALSAP